MKNIVIFFSFFAIMAVTPVSGSSYDDRGIRGRSATSIIVFKTPCDPDKIVRSNVVVTQNPLFRREIPNGSACGTRASGKEGEKGRLVDDGTTLPRVSSLPLGETKKLFPVSPLKRGKASGKMDSFRKGQYTGALRATGHQKSFAEELREKNEELKTTKADPKDPRFQKLFLDTEAPHGLNLENINKRRELVRDGAGVEGGGDDFSNLLALVQKTLGIIKREEEEIEKLKSLIVKVKTIALNLVEAECALKAYKASVITLSRSANTCKLLIAREGVSEEAVSGLETAESSLEKIGGEIADIQKTIERLQKELEQTRELEDLELELARTKKRLLSFESSKNRALNNLAQYTRTPSNTLEEHLPPIVPKGRSPAGGAWD